MQNRIQVSKGEMSCYPKEKTSCLNYRDKT